MFNNFTIISVHTPKDEKEEQIKDSFYNKLNEIYQRIPAGYKNYNGQFQCKNRKE